MRLDASLKLPLSNFILGLLILLVFPYLLFAEQSGPTTLRLQGYLGKDEVVQAEKFIKQASVSESDILIIEIDSSNGDLGEVLKLAKSIYALRASKQKEIVVYIQDSAVGPAAVIPFLADKLYTSFFVSWGDIPLGDEGSVPSNILRNTVRSLISPENPKFELLLVMASAMSDPKIQLIDDQGWKIGKANGKQAISPEGETLVVNHQQLKALGLISGMMTFDDFRKLFKSQKESGLENKSEINQKNGPSFEQSLEKHILYNPKGPNTIGLIKVDEKNSEISQATWIYVKAGLDYYKKTRPAFVILELNTPGGEVFSAQKISDALKEMDTQYGIPVVAFVNNWAISAGAMLAYSCRYITVTKDASMGAAEPVIAGEGGKLVAASEKVNSALRADFANRAGFFDRNPSIAEAMVDKDIILVDRFGRVIKLDKEDQIRKTDVVISPKGKLLTLNAEQAIKYGVANYLLEPIRLKLITESERKRGKWPAEKTLLFQIPFLKKIPSATIDLYKMDWKTRFLSLISSPVVSSLLFLGMLLGAYVEFNTPGFGFPGSLALLCLSVILLSSFALDIANMLEVLLLFMGIVFIAIDLFFIPTFGILGITGIVFFIIGLFGLMLPGVGNVQYEFDSHTFNAAGEVFIKRLAWLSGTLVLGVILIALMARYVMPTFQGFARIVLAGNEETAADGYIAGADPKTLPPPGSKGEALATLRPSGKVLINDQIYDAITSGGFIEKGSKVIVDKLDGSVIMVEKDKGQD